MDEPTNNLDVAARGIVREALASFEGIGILISRDRDLLDDFPGALLMVTHDRLLSEAVTQIAWETIHGEKLVRLQIV